MPALSTYDYAVIRVVPRVERGEFINAGIILWCADRQFAEARIALDERRALAIDPTLDLPALRDQLAALAVVCAGGAAAGPLGSLSRRERFLLLVAPRSTIVQTSPVHTGLCADPATTLDRLLRQLVCTP